MNLDPAAAQLLDPRWRLANLYRIITDDSREMAFVPNAEQWDLYDNLWHRNLILKARQLGFTTFVDLLFLDRCFWNANTTAVIIAHTLDDAAKIFRNKIVYPLEHLPAEIAQINRVKKKSESEVIFENGSSISVSTSARSGTIQLLHVSEAGKIAKRYPEKMREITTGSFEAVPQDGLIIVESTAEGRDGWFYKAVTDAQKRAQTGRKPEKLEFRLHFYPWWRKDANRSDALNVPISDELQRYFSRLNAEAGITLDAMQRAWYALKHGTLTDDMKREHPSTPAESFETATEGIIYWRQMAYLRKAGRIGRISVRPELRVNSFWDLGKRDFTVVWLHQEAGTEQRFIKCWGEAGLGLAAWWTRMLAWQEELQDLLGSPIRWGVHHLPHDGDTGMQARKIITPRSELEELAPGQTFVAVPRVLNIDTGLKVTRQKMMDYVIDEVECEEGIRALDNYQFEWDDNAGAWKATPLHNWASHYADAIRQHAQGYERPSAVVTGVRDAVVLPPRVYGGGSY